MIVSDRKELIKTADFQYAKFPFEYLNPPQSKAFEYYDKDVNFIASAHMGTGKTEIAEMFMSYEIRKNNTKAIYLPPFKALAQEKYDDWTSLKHHFSNLKITIYTGDYSKQEGKEKELQEADIIIMTLEMLNSFSRQKSNKSNFLKEIGLLVIDEFHLVGNSMGRSDHLECGLMNFTKINKKSKILGLSGTFPNANQIAEWVSLLNKKETIVLKSEYRAVPLNIHYKEYEDRGNYYEVEQHKVDSAFKLLREYPDDKFIIFAHTKKTGMIMVEKLKSYNMETYFHSTTLDKQKRLEVTRRFMEDPKLRVIVATSGLSAGVNLPCRRVIILGDKRGLEEVSSLEIHQECISINSDILMVNNTTKKAKDVKIGDKILAVNENNEITNAEINSVIHSKGTLKHFKFSNGEIASFKNHPLLKRNYSWINSDDTEINDEICCITNGTLSYTTIVEITKDKDETDLINFSVPGCNTFIVNNIVTHNCGRAGRPKYDKHGDAYVLVPRTKKNIVVNRIQTPENIISQLLTPEDPLCPALAFHVVSEIYSKNICNIEDLRKWYQRTLSHHQAKDLDELTIDQLLTNLKNYNIIETNDDELSVTKLGKISSLFYYSPYDVSDLKRNFDQLFHAKKQDNDHWLSMAMGYLSGSRKLTVSNDDKSEMSDYYRAINQTNVLNKSYENDYNILKKVKSGYCYYLLLIGESSPSLNAIIVNYKMDIGRLIEMLSSIDAMTGKWNKGKFWDNLKIRLNKGVGVDLLSICTLNGIGKTRGHKLFNFGLKTLEDIANKPNAVQQALHCTAKRAMELSNQAKVLVQR